MNYFQNVKRKKVNLKAGDQEKICTWPFNTCFLIPCFCLRICLQINFSIRDLNFGFNCTVEILDFYFLLAWNNINLIGNLNTIFCTHDTKL